MRDYPCANCTGNKFAGLFLAAAIAPSPDFLNMTPFAVPMCLLFFPVALVTGAAVVILVIEFHAHWIRQWPFVVK